MIIEHLDKNNLHHAYLIEGARDKVLPEIIKFLKSIGIPTVGNPDFINITIDNLKIDEALDLRAMSFDKSFSGTKKVFVICANTFSMDAENVLLKMFEEPTENTHFFLIVPDVNILLKTLVSRFYLIKSEALLDTKEAEKFISMSLASRINFIKELLTEDEEEDAEGNEIVALDSTRAKAIKFLNTLEVALHGKLLKNYAGSSLPGVPGGSHADQNFLEVCLKHFLKVREFLRMPGSSTKSLMESVALIIPVLQ